MAVRAPLAASLAVVALVACAHVATAKPRLDGICKAVDAKGNVTYRDCPPPTTYKAPEPAPPPIVEEARPAPVIEVAAEPPARRILPGFGGAPAGRTTYPIAGIPLLFMGMVVALAAGISFLVAAFRVNLWWGLGCIFLSPVSPVFLVLHWNVAKRPFVASLLGLGAALVGYYVLGGGS
jgi:hypothetical protein